MDISYYKQYEPVFGSWYIKGLLGEGGFGSVYEMERKEMGVTYKSALKTITIPQNQNEVRNVMSDGMTKEDVTAYYSDIVQDLIREIVLMSKLKGNSNIVSYEDHLLEEHKDKVGWDILIRMELLKPLNDYILETTISKKDVIQLGIDICKALEVCQRYNIIHRDVKPENIFISPIGAYKLGDFGIARTVEKTNSGLSKKGTYTYMAPEVYRGDKYDSTVDLYSLGIVMYRLLNNNRTPFLPPYPERIPYNDKENALIKRVSGLAFPLPVNGQDRLGEIVLKACAFDPENRYSSPLQMRQELEAVMSETKDVQLTCTGVGQNTDSATETIAATSVDEAYDEEATSVLEFPALVGEDDERTVPLSAPYYKPDVYEDDDVTVDHETANYRSVSSSVEIVTPFVEKGPSEEKKAERETNSGPETKQTKVVKSNPETKQTKKIKAEPVKEAGLAKQEKSNLPIIIGIAIALLIGLIVFLIIPDKVEVEEISNVKSKITITVDETYKLKPLLLPEEAADTKVEYSSDKPKVVHVTEEGVIVAKSEGTALIQIIAGEVKKEVKVIVESKETEEREDYTDYTYYENEDEEVEQPDNKEETVTDNPETTDGTGEVGAEEELPPEEMGEVSDVENEGYEEFAPEDSVQIRVEEDYL